MKKHVLVLIATLLAFLTGGPQAADESPRKSMVGTVLDQEAIELHLLLRGHETIFELIPGILILQAGKPYKLVIQNLSDVTHVLSVPKFSGPTFVCSCVSLPRARAQVAAGETVEWYFVPTKAGRYEMGCAERAHAEAGMTGTIVVN